MLKIATILVFLISYFLFMPNIVFADSKRIEVNLTNQQLYAFEGDKMIYNFPVSSGTIRTPTPIGEFRPYVKLLSTRMKGPGYDLANVPYTMYFYQGYGIHGAYWHNNFGHPMSHGCINVHPANMALLYNWTDINTQIKIYGLTPGG